MGAGRGELDFSRIKLTIDLSYSSRLPSMLFRSSQYLQHDYRKINTSKNGSQLLRKLFRYLLSSTPPVYANPRSKAGPRR